MEELQQQQQVYVQNTGWASFAGILMIIVGALYSLTIVGAIVGVPVILMGIKYNNANKYANELKVDGRLDTAVKAINEFNGGFKIQGIMFIVSMSISLLSIVLMLALGVFTAAQFM